MLQKEEAGNNKTVNRQYTLFSEGSCVSSLQDSQEKNANPVQAEEAKLKARYPHLTMKPGGPDFLMKKLHRGVGPDCFLFVALLPGPGPGPEPLKLYLTAQIFNRGSAEHPIRKGQALWGVGGAGFRKMLLEGNNGSLI